MFTSTTIALASPAASSCDIVAAAGPTDESALQVTLSVNEADPEGRGLSGTAFRSGSPASSTIIWPTSAPRISQHGRAAGARSGAGFPLFVQRARRSASCSSSPCEKDTFTPEFAELLQRLTDNVSFALENFDRADDKARTEVQKERLTRMFAALSATNEAIMRAKSRAELFELVCEAAANGGKFTSTTIALAEPASDFLRIVAAAGPTAETTRHVRLSVNEAHPEGRGLSGTAFRTRQACIINDYVADQRVGAFHAIARTDGAQSGAAFPLLVARGSRRRHDLHVRREGHVHARIRRTAAAARRQRIVCAGEFRPRRRKDQGGRTDRISGVARQPDRPAQPGNVQRHAAPRDRGRRALSAAICAAVHRSRQVQGHQRFAGPRRRRHAAGGNRRQAAPCAAFERRRGAARRRRVRRHSGGSCRAPRGRAHRRRAAVRAEPTLAVERPRMPHHGLDRHRDVSVRRHRHADADQECRHGDVSRQGGRQERLPLLQPGRSRRSRSSA